MHTLLGLFLHAVGGFCAASFYLPINRVKQWAWETYWLVQGFASWIIAPWVLSWLTVPDGQLLQILSQAPASNVFWACFFGAMWGLGGLTFGLSLRYLGISLGQSVALGFCTAFGTMVPPVWYGELSSLFGTLSGIITLVGVSVCLAGIAVVGYAGTLKEKSLTEAEKRAAIREFALRKGLLIAVFSGIMSSCMAFAISAGTPIRDLAVRLGTDPIFSNNPVYIFIMFGGFLSNFTWCMILGIRNRNLHDYIALRGMPLARNLFYSWLGGTTWYFQFFFYGMGERQLGEAFNFASWSIHMAFIIAFSNMWGLILKEWRGCRSNIIAVLLAGIIILIASTFIIGWGTYLENP
jgi:L-rhamnose-H+ transport protein